MLLTESLAEPEKDHPGLLFRLQAHQQYRTGILKISKADSESGAGYGMSQEVRLLTGVLPGPEVDVVGAEHGSSELRIAVGVLQGEPPTGQHADRVSRCPETLHGYIDCFGPGCWPQYVTISHQRSGKAIVEIPVAMREAIFVGDPLLIDLRIVPGEAAHHGATSMINADRRAAGVMLGDRGCGDQVEGPRPEPVRRTGQSADWADLDGVAREVGLERFLFVDADLLQRATLDQRYERITGNLLGEPGAARAQHAAFPIKQHVGRDIDRLRIGALLVGEPALRVAVGHRLVLQRALTALVADRAVKRMVDQQELHVPALRLVRDRGGELRLDLHTRCDFEGAGGLWLGDWTPRATIGHLDQALPTGADRLEQRMITKARYFDSNELRRTNHQGALGHRHLDVVDGESDQVLPLLNSRACRSTCCRDGHAPAPAGSRTKIVLRS